MEDLDAAIETAKSLGGSVVQPPAGEDSPSAIMADPEGNEFCMGVW